MPFRQLLGGLLFVSGGLFMSLIGLFLEVDSKIAFVAFGTLFFGLPFILGGLMIWEIHERLPFMRRVHGVSWPELFAGIMAILLGSLIAIMSFADPREEAFSAPRWVVTVAGGCFVFAGLAVAWHAVAQRWPSLSDVMGRITGSLLVTAMAIVACAVVFYPGRESLSTPWVGRILFSVGALVMVAIAVIIWIRVVRTVRGAGRESDSRVWPR